MPNAASILSYPSVRKIEGVPVYHTLRSQTDGTIIGLKSAQPGRATATFKVFSGYKNPLTNHVLPQGVEGGAIPAGTWYISNLGGYGNHPHRIARNMVSPKILSLPPDELDKAIRTNSYWLALYRDDRSQGGEIDDKTMVNGVKRTEFRLHYGHYSLGCMTFEKSSDFREMMLSLAKTPAIYINKKGEKVEKDSLGSIQVYGKLIIPDPIPQIPISSRNPPQRRN